MAHKLVDDHGDLVVVGFSYRDRTGASFTARSTNLARLRDREAGPLTRLYTKAELGPITPPTVTALDPANPPEPEMATWLNAMQCIRPTAEFCEDLGRQIIETLRSDPCRNEKKSLWALTVKVVMS